MEIMEEAKEEAPVRRKQRVQQPKQPKKPKKSKFEGPDPKKGGDKAAITTSCSICGKEFASKTKLFKHLEEHGWEPEAVDVAIKTALLVGWLRSYPGEENGDGDSSRIGDDSSDTRDAPCSVGSMGSAGSVGCSLIAAVDGVDGEMRDRTSFSAAQCGTSSSVAAASRAAADHGAVADLWMLPLVRLSEQTQAASEEWVTRVNGALSAAGAEVMVLDRITLPIKELDPEGVCTSRVYETLFPVDALMPADTPEGDALIASLFDTVNQWKAAKGVDIVDVDRYCEPKELQWNKSDDPAHEQPKKYLTTTRSRQFFGALKQVMKRLCDRSMGRRSWHNFTPLRLSPGDQSARKRMGRFFHMGIIEQGGRLYSRMRISGEMLLQGQVRCMQGLLLAIARGVVPARAVDHALSDDIFDVLPIPEWSTGYIHEVKFEKWETKHRQVLDPRRQDRLAKMERPTEEEAPDAATTEQQRARAVETAPKLSAAEGRLLAWEEKVVEHAVAQITARGSDWLGPFDVAWAREWARYSTELRLKARSFNDDHDDASATAAATAATTTAAGTTAGSTAGTTAGAALPQEYLEVLRLLREASEGGLWPETTDARKKVIDEEGTGGNAQGGSFSVGAMPEGMAAPRGNALFPELLRAAFKLERVISPPDRKPSSTIAINRHATFLPHRDTGAGAGQTLSCIVALGDFQGGEVVVEGAVHDIRYNPVQFDGWKQRHWTLPFSGERFSLVYFTPLGVTDDRLFWNFE